MDCKYFGQCGACRLYEDGYSGQLEKKVQENKERFSHYYKGDISVYASKEEHYRARAEFKIWHVDDEIHYAMNHIEHKGVVLIESCPQVSEFINILMPKLLTAVKEEKLGQKLFG
ncbi:MAG: tRNA (uridine(54)-C5)-methyltransferase TrmA, partial [Sulfurimonas sp.]